MADPAGKAPAVIRAVKILELLAASGQSLSMSEIARSLSMAKSSTSNICQALADGGLVARTEGGFALGSRTVDLASAYLHTFDPVREFYRMCSAGGILGTELAQLAVLTDTDALSIARHQGQSAVRHGLRAGGAYPAEQSALGRALLAQLPIEEIDQRFGASANQTRPPTTAAARAALLQRLAGVRRQGYATDEQEVQPNVVGLAVAIPARSTGSPAMALGVAVLASAASDRYREQIVAALHQAAARLSPAKPALN